jgi:uncharacterized hydantoinase/oxoprolinase family protein
MVCADLELLDQATIEAIARALSEAQIERVRSGLARVKARWPKLTTAVITGIGSFLAAVAAEREGFAVADLADQIGVDAARTAPAAAVALLLGAEA